VPPPEKGDPVIPYTGNEFKRVDDLQIWGAVGGIPMTWSRHSNSRAVSGGSLFGMGHYWRHGFQYELAAVSPDASGRRQLSIVYPSGAQFTFVETAPGVWASVGALTDKLVADGENLLLVQKGGESCRFRKTTVGATVYYLMDEMRDVSGNACLLEYNGSRQLTKVTEPAGRSFSVSYTTLTGNRLNPATLATLGAAPASGAGTELHPGARNSLRSAPAERAWTEFTVNNSTAFRYVRLVQADGSFGQIAEVEFYEAGTGAKLTGQILCSDTADAAKPAFDGLPDTGFVSAAQSGGFVGLDLGSARKIGRVRFLSVAGKEALQKPTAWGATAVRIEGANFAPVSALAIASVQTGDGRSVTYDYTPFNDPSLPYTFPCLTGARYSDGTQAGYQYVQVFPGTRPLVGEWDDVRYDLRQGRYRTVYQNSITGAVLGSVTSQVNLATGRPILTIGRYNNNLHQPMVTYGNGGRDVQIYNTSLHTGAAIAQEIDANNNSTFYTYDANGYMATKKDPLGRVTSYTWTPQGTPLTQIHPDGSVERWGYNEKNLLVSHTDTLGRTTAHTRDNRNRITRTDYPDGSFEAWEYNALGQVTAHRLRNGGVERSEYDERALLVRKLDPLGNATTYGYDAADRLALVTDALGRATRMDYNERGLVTRITHPDGTTRLRAYTLHGDLASETDETGNTRSFTYDVFRRVTSVTDPLGRTAATEYHPDAFHRAPLAVTAPSGRRTTLAYDPGWRLLRKTVGAGTAQAATTTMAYDKADNVLSATDALGKTTAFTYDARDRRITATDPLGNVSRWTYDSEGNALTETRPDAGVTTKVYDAMDRLVTVTDPKGQTTAMGYDAAGNLVAMADAKGNTYGYSHDLLNRRTELVYPGGSREQYRYDAVGNGIGYTTRAGQVRTSTFDLRNREVQTSWSDATPSILRSFDPAGRVLSEENGLARLDYRYDAAGQLLAETSTVTGQPARTVAFAYDVDGRETAASYPGGSVVGTDHTARGEVAGISLDGAQVAAYEYNLVGRTTAKTLENGIRTTFGYDAAHRLTQIEHRRGNELLTAFGYTLDRVGNRTSKTQTGLNPLIESYAYDAVDQLVQASYGGARTVAYQYDRVGNRQSVTENGRAEAYTVNADNGYTSVGGENTVSDANGNLATAKGGVYAYDAQNRLVSASVGGTTTTFGYDPRNRVVRRSVNGTESHLSYSGWDLIEERDGSGALVGIYVHGAATDELLVKVDRRGAAYYHQDGLGSTVALTGPGGALIESCAYDAFGAATVRDATGRVVAESGVGNRFLFTGREWLAQAGLYDYRNRVYSAELGRFLQTDPIRFAAGDVNVYRYCGNNAPNSTDPMGLDEKKKKKDGGKDDEFRVEGGGGVDRGGGGGGGGGGGWLDNASNFAAGMADTLSFGVTGMIRESLPGIYGQGGGVDKASTAYGAGVVDGTANASARGAAGALRGGAQIAIANRGNAIGKWLSQGRTWRLGASGGKQIPTLRIGAARPPTRYNHIDLTILGR
jgi:RHS repeat-associated protein